MPGTICRTITPGRELTAGGEDGLAVICDYKQRLCFAWAFWNGKDPILKERFFGLTGPQGNHGEDVKELTALVAKLIQQQGEFGTISQSSLTADFR